MGLNHTAPIGDYTLLHLNALQTTAIPASPAQVNTTASTTIAVGSATVTPASMANISVGDWLDIYGGTGTAESVQVTATTATTFTATFVNTHSGTYNICSKRPSRVGFFTTNQAGTSITVTLYDGNPNDTANPNRKTLAVIAPSYGSLHFQGRCNYGLWYTVTGTTAGDYTLSYIDLPL